MAIKNVEKFQNVIGAKDTLMISIIISKNIERLNRTLNFLNPESKKRGELNIHFSDSGSSEFIIQLFRNLIKNDTQLNSEAYNALWNLLLTFKTCKSFIIEIKEYYQNN